MEKKDEFARILRLLSIAIEDLNKSGTFIDGEKVDDQFYRRLFIRNVFSVIESYIHVTKEIIVFKLVVDGTTDNNLSWTEMVILNEKKVLLDNKGNVKTINEFQNFEQSLRFTFNTFAKVFNVEPPDYSDNNYNNLLKLSKRRNDITHPKSMEKLIITNQELKDMISSLGWFIKLNHKLISKLTSWLENTLK